MKIAKYQRSGGFTLIEIIVALAIFILVVTAIYSSWTTIIKASKTGMEAAAQAQRERMAIQTIVEALTSARSFAADLQHYGFVAENGSDATLSFVARLPKSFPRSGKFGDLDVRRVSFTVERGTDSARELTLRQSPILMEFDEDERDHPLVLARDVKDLLLAFWEPRTGDWVEDWAQSNTNQLPKMMKITLRLNDPHHRPGYSQQHEEVTRVVALPAVTVQPTWQTPNVGGKPGG